jgi:hypothetical protein
MGGNERDTPRGCSGRTGVAMTYTSHTFFASIFGGLLAFSAALGCGGSDPSDPSGTGASGSTNGAGGQGAGGQGQGGQGAGFVIGDPIDAPDGEWTYVAFPDAKCMNDTPTGIGINKTSASEDVVIYLAGGNACFNSLTCAITANVDGYGEADFDAEKGGLDGAPLFSREPGSLFADYNLVYVPYCTGDVHAGNADTEVGGTMRAFRGAPNMELYLGRLIPTFPNAKRLLITGVSAGGFGAAFNYDRVARAFPDVKVMLLDDSGPPMAEEFVPACLQKAFSDIWGLSKTMPGACADCVNESGVFMEPFVKYMADTYADRRLALVSGTEDATISRFWGFGNDDCANLASFPGAYPGSKYTEGLEDLRDRVVSSSNNFKSFLIDGSGGMDPTQHTWLGEDPEGVVSNGVTLADWLDDMVNGSGGWEHVPAP